jgi:hypothetical protein
MILGLLCYSEQQLLLSETEGITTHKEANLFLLFRFVKQHYKKRWIVLLFLNLFVLKTISILFVSLCFFKNRKKTALKSQFQ